MKYNLEIVFNQDEKKVSVLDVNFIDNELDILIHAPSMFSIEKFMPSESLIKEILSNNIDFLDMFHDDLIERKNALSLIKNYLNGNIELDKSPKVISFVNYSHEDVISFLEKYPNLPIKIVIPGIYTIDSDLTTIEKLYEKYSNVYIYADGNTVPVRISEFSKTIEILDDMANEIKSYNYSPFEALIHAYDLVRERVYNLEDENESSNVSRDLTSVLLGDKIVCVGFSKILMSILNKIGISNSIVDLDDIDKHGSGHVRNVVYLNDPKYKIDGIYYLDATWDCQKKNENRDFLYSYQFFAKIKYEIERYLQGQYMDNYLSYLNDKSMYDLINEFETSFDENGKYVGESLEEALVIVRTINHLSNLVDKCDIMKFLIFTIGEYNFDRQSILEKLSYYDELLNSYINCETFLRALLVVRKNEYYKDQENYPLSVEVFKKIAINSGFIFNNTETKLLFSLLGELPSIKQIALTNSRLIDLFLQESGIKEKIEQIKTQKKLIK